jgi:hypothetical protein
MAPITHDPRTPGYAAPMLAVVILLPITIMLMACLLERFEAHATRMPATTPPRPAGRPRSSEPGGPALALVPGTARESDAPATMRDAGDRELRRAS